MKASGLRNIHLELFLDVKSGVLCIDHIEEDGKYWRVARKISPLIIRALGDSNLAACFDEMRDEFIKDRAYVPEEGKE
jgi:hypothetical protein